MAAETERDDNDSNNGACDVDALCEVARHDVQRAQEGSRTSGQRVVRLAAVALRNLLDRGQMPSPRDSVYLRALLESIEAIGMKREDANAALHLKPSHRPEDPDRPVEQQLLFVEVGREYDCLKTKGDIRSDAPIRRAIQVIAKRNATTPARVKHAWKTFGAEDGWNEWLALQREDALKEK